MTTKELNALKVGEPIWYVAHWLERAVPQVLEGRVLALYGFGLHPTRRPGQAFIEIQLHSGDSSSEYSLKHFMRDHWITREEASRHLKTRVREGVI